MSAFAENVLIDFWNWVSSSFAKIFESDSSATLEGLSVISALASIGWAVLLFVVIWAAHRATTRWRSQILRWLTVIVVIAVLPAIIYSVYHTHKIEGLTICAVTFFVACIVWQQDILREYQQKFLDHDQKLIDIFEQNTGLNPEARKLHGSTLVELKKMQRHLSGRFDLDDGFYNETYKSKLGQICSQIGKEEVYVREAEFKGLWKKLVDISTRYVSVCDLSFYADVTIITGDAKSRKDYDLANEYWTYRVGREIEELIKTKKCPHTFQKVIVYSPLNRYDEPDNPPPCAAPTSQCDPQNCGKTCIVKTVTQLWKDNESRFEANVVGLFKRVHGAHHTPFIWLVSKEEIDRKFVAIGGTDGVSKGPSLDSVDIGVFGGHFVGEEFKVPAGIGAARVQDYLYRIRFNTDLANRIHEACDKLRTVKTIHAA